MNSWHGSRRGFLAAATLPLLAACGTPLPLHRQGTSSAEAAARLADSAQAHGLAAYQQITDINISYDGQWRPLIGRIQPEVVDSAFRISSQERLLPALGVVAQSYTGPQGNKHVFWQRNQADIGVWYNGSASKSASVEAAAAMVAECYGLFLLGPLWLSSRQAEKPLVLVMGGTERVNDRLCDVVHAWLSPGFGRATMDRISLCIDKQDHITRRLRFTLEGYPGTQGAVAEVDVLAFERHFGVLWPMRSYEEVVHPLRLPAHDWWVTGLDINRGLALEDLRGPQFRGRAIAAAAAVSTASRLGQ
ncbi:MAG: hypothetical protein HEQ39_00390 [Rhizobacter sp.]